MCFTVVCLPACLDLLLNFVMLNFINLPSPVSLQPWQMIELAQMDNRAKSLSLFSFRKNFCFFGQQLPSGQRDPKEVCFLLLSHRLKYHEMRRWEIPLLTFLFFISCLLELCVRKWKWYAYVMALTRANKTALHVALFAQHAQFTCADDEYGLFRF